jgi:hypothetical protein
MIVNLPFVPSPDHDAVCFPPDALTLAVKRSSVVAPDCVPLEVATYCTEDARETFASTLAYSFPAAVVGTVVAVVGAVVVVATVVGVVVVLDVLTPEGELEQPPRATARATKARRPPVI